jgi:abhydrolase domain-containing protein 12
MPVGIFQCATLALLSVFLSFAIFIGVLLDLGLVQFVASLVSVLLVFYCSFIITVSHNKTLQIGMMYLNWTKKFRASDQLRNLRSLGLQSQCRNIETKTEDGLILNGYHMIPSRHSLKVNTLNANETSKSKKNKDIDTYFEQSLNASKLVFLYMHGIALDRAFTYRIETMRYLSDNFDAHVIAFDYRGFGDCKGEPSQTGTHLDARAMNEWLNNATRNSEATKVLYGHSMGASVSAFLLADDQADTGYSGFIINGAFDTGLECCRHSNVSKVLKLIPPLFDYMLKHWNLCSDGYKTIDIIDKIDKNIPVLQIHGDKDHVVPYHLGKKLYSAFVKVREKKVTNESNDSSSKNANTNVEFVTIESGLHSDNIKFPLWVTSIANFLEKL